MRPYLASALSFAIILALSLEPVVMAAGFAEPPDVSNYQKAHQNIIFTGSGEEESGDDTCSTDAGVIGEISKSFNLGTDPKERRVNLIKAFMAEYGLTAEQAAGPVGNFMREAAGTVTEAKKLPPDVNQGEVSGAPPNGSDLGYGWAQWSGPRKTAFVTFMRSKGYVTDRGNATDAADFAYLKKELDSPGYASTITELKKQSTPEDAAVSFEATFERAGVPALEDRKKFAREAYDDYKASNGGDAAGDNTSSGDCGGVTSSVNFGEVSFPLKGSKKVVSSPGMFQNGTTQTSGHPYTAYDIMSPGGTPIRAFISGKVSYFFNDTCGGDSVTIWNEQLKIGISYMHMNRGDIIPKMNQSVRVGEVIGKVGAWDGGCGGDHLHIDASTDKIRQPCSRAGCSEEVKSHFRSMGKELFDTYQLLPDN